MTPADRPVPDPIGTRSIWCAGLAAILAIEIVAIGSYAYYRLQTALKPENVADRVEAAIEENYPEIREQLVSRVRQQAPQIAEQVSQELIEAAPAGRVRLEEFTRRQIKHGLDEATDLSAEQFRSVLKNNHDQIVKAFEAVEAAPQDVRQLVLETEDDIESTLGIDLQRQARTALQVHRQLNDKLDRLNGPTASLEPRELLERRMVRILKTIQLRESDVRVASEASLPQVQ